MFWKNLLPPSSDELKQVASCSYRMPVRFHQTTAQRNNEAHKNVNAGLLLCNETGSGTVIICALYVSADLKIKHTHYL
jgi:hypothetical protein